MEASTHHVSVWPRGIIFFLLGLARHIGWLTNLCGKSGGSCSITFDPSWTLMDFFAGKAHAAQLAWHLSRPQGQEALCRMDNG